jgi:hypothetical protein
MPTVNVQIWLQYLASASIEGSQGNYFVANGMLQAIKGCVLIQYE